MDSEKYHRRATGFYIRDHIAASQKDAIRMAINAGVDMMMVPSQLNYGETLKQLVEDGCVAQERIDDAVRRILRLKYRLNLFDNPYSNDNKYPLFGSAAHAAVAKQMAVESEILLKNEDNILPLQDASGRYPLISSIEISVLQGFGLHSSFDLCLTFSVRNASHGCRCRSPPAD